MHIYSMRSTRFTVSMHICGDSSSLQQVSVMYVVE